MIRPAWEGDVTTLEQNCGACPLKPVHKPVCGADEGGTENSPEGIAKLFR